VRLLRVYDVAGKQDHSTGLNAGEQRAENGRDFGAVKADDEQLANIGGFGVRSCRHAVERYFTSRRQLQKPFHRRDRREIN
jgi:hypothetical protein